jgi:hypothetical protein
MGSFTIAGDIPDTNIQELRLCIGKALKIDNIKKSVDNIYIENEVFSLYIFEFNPPISIVDPFDRKGTDSGPLLNLWTKFINGIQSNLEDTFGKSSEIIVRNSGASDCVDSNQWFLVSSGYEGSFEEMKIFLKNISQSLYESNIKFEFEFYEDGENTDNPSWVMRYPEYYAGNSGIFVDFQVL